MLLGRFFQAFSINPPMREEKRLPADLIMKRAEFAFRELYRRGVVELGENWDEQKYQREWREFYLLLEGALYADEVMYLEQ